MSTDRDGRLMTCEMTTGDAGMSRCGRPAEFLIIDRFGVGEFGEGRVAIAAYCDADARYLIRPEPYRRLITVVPL